MTNDEQVMQVLRDAKKLAQRYRALTRKPLGITGEVAEYEAARILGVKLTPARQAGYDAVEGNRRLQIKGRCLLPGWASVRGRPGAVRDAGSGWGDRFRTGHRRRVCDQHDR